MASTQQDGKRRLGEWVVVPGVVAGLAGAVAMILLMLAVSAARGAGLFDPARQIAAVLLGEAALEAGAGAVVVGLAVHLAIGAVLGVLFAAFVSTETGYALELGLGLLYGAVIFVLMTFLILPWANPVMAAAVDPWWFFIAHLIYGATVTLVLPLQRVAGVPEQRGASRTR